MKVTIEYYRYAGRFLFFKVNDRCDECDLTFSILNRLQSELFAAKNINLIIKPYYNNLVSLRIRGGRKAPLIYINRVKFSEGIIPNVKSLIRHIASILDDKELLKKADHYDNYRIIIKKELDENLPLIYGSSSCPHCRALKRYLETNNINYNEKNIVEDHLALMELKEISQSMTIPVLLYNKNIIHGFDQNAIASILNIKEIKSVNSSENLPEGPKIKPTELEEAQKKAIDLLEQNRNGDITKPSLQLYPHQWSWDSAFIARGRLYYDPPSAYREMKSLFKGQWSDGFLPHIIFNKEYLGHFPGPHYWKAEHSGRVPKGIFTSGISQPPIHASMISAAIDIDPSKERALKELKELYPKLKAMHDFYFSNRFVNNLGLIFLVHPWESGLDNAPLWDIPLAGVNKSSRWAKKMQKKYNHLAIQGERPSRSYIEKYSYLVQCLFFMKYNWKEIKKKHPFKVCDVLFNSVLCKSEADLGRIASFIGENPKLHEKRCEELKKAINLSLWDDQEGNYFDLDLISGEYIKRDTVFSYIPLYGNICSKEQGERLIGNLKSHCFCISERDCMGIPSYDMCKTDYDGEFYWRGPIWYNMSWYVYQGLKNYGYIEDAIWLKKSLFQLVISHGFHEYYQPEKGAGLGAGEFSWTAALFLDLIGGEDGN